MQAVRATRDGPEGYFRSSEADFRSSETDAEDGALLEELDAALEESMFELAREVDLKLDYIFVCLRRRENADD